MLFGELENHFYNISSEEWLFVFPFDNDKRNSYLVKPDSWCESWRKTHFETTDDNDWEKIRVVSK